MTMAPTWLEQKTCTRCHADLRHTAYSMSFFNEDTICTDCIKDERDAPGFAEAKRVEAEHVRAGNYNFKGIGLSPDDRAFLARRLENRRSKA